MARKYKSPALNDAKKFYKLLLFEASGGNLGIKPEKKSEKETLTFVEKNRLLTEIVKIAGIEQKTMENDEGESGFDKIRKDLYAGRTSEHSGDTGGGAESGSYGDTGTSAEDDAASES